MIRRRIFLGDNEPYTEIVYLKSTGTQYIDTGYKPNQNTKIVCTMKADENSDYGRLFGCNGGTSWNSTPNYQMDYQTGSEGNFNVLMGNNTEWSSYSSYKGDYNIHDYVIDKGNAYRDGTLIHTNNAGDFQCATNLAIYSMMYANGISSSSSEFFRGRVYSFQIYDDDVLVRDFVPVEVEGVGYLYDKVTKQLYGNAGTGNFVLGPSSKEKVIMTTETNPEVLAICYAQGWCSDPTYMTNWEANSVVNVGTVFSGSNITHFEEFRHFDNITSLSNKAFDSCSDLEIISLPLGITSLSNDAFNGCSSLRRITMSESVTDLGQYTFRGCSSLEYFKIPSGVTAIKSAVFQNCTSCEIELHDNIVSVWSRAFENTNFVNGFGYFPNVSSVDGAAFSSNKASELYFGANLTSFGSSICNYCPNLKKVTFMGNISDIPYGTFGSAGNVDTLVINSRVAPTTNQYAITQVADNGTLYIPCDSSGYNSGDWANLVNNKGWTIVYGDIYPQNFVSIEYLYSYGREGNEYINLNRIPGDNTRILIDCKGWSGTTGQDVYEMVPFGCEYDYVFQCSFRLKMTGWYLGGVTVSNALTCDYGNYGIRGIQRHVYEFSNSECYLDGDLVYSATTSPTYYSDMGYNKVAFLFSGSFNNQPSYTFRGYIYGFKWWENGSLVMDLIPGRIGTVGCMYNKVDGKVFYNNGSGNFDLGPDVQAAQAIDLGLPSGHKWANMNVGASSPEDYGMYFSWGNVTGHYAETNYGFSQDKYDSSLGATLTTSIPVGNEYDMAYANMGCNWRVPSMEDFEELETNCTYQWTALNGKNGMLFTSKNNGNSVFFPACGFCNSTGGTISQSDSTGTYWSKTQASTSNAYHMIINSGGVNPFDQYLKFWGRSVRAIKY